MSNSIPLSIVVNNIIQNVLEETDCIQENNCNKKKLICPYQITNGNIQTISLELKNNKVNNEIKINN